MTIKEIQTKYFKQVSPIDLDLLLEFILGKPREFLITNPQHKLSSPQNLKIKYYIRQLRRHKPIDYIIGRKEFYGLTFKVNKHTLVPRPETEQMIDLAKNILLSNLQKSFTVIDLGTGSGNIIISLAKNFPRAYFYASDISRQALSTAKINALFHQSRIKFVQGSLLKPFEKLLTTNTPRPKISGCCSNISVSCQASPQDKISNKYLLITANLPYLSQKIYQQTDTKVRKYEPVTALVSGPDGLDHYNKLLQELAAIKKSKKFSFQKTFLLLEISPEQKNKLISQIKTQFPEALIIPYRDLAQKWRMIQVEL